MNKYLCGLIFKAFICSFFFFKKKLKQIMRVLFFFVFKDTVIKFLFKIGFIKLLIHLRCRKKLTVVMFHRILPESDQRFYGSIPDWTISPKCFEQCILFFKKYYTVISFEELRNNIYKGIQLPPYSLLITFDDGWQDNYQYAYPILKQNGLSALFFIVSDTVGHQKPFWEEQIYYEWYRNRLSDDFLYKFYEFNYNGLTYSNKFSENDIFSIIKIISNFPNALREKLLRKLDFLPTDFPAMISHNELQTITKQGMSIGSHSQTHLPLAQVNDPCSELLESRKKIAFLLDIPQKSLDSLSYPHGSVTKALIHCATSIGYKFQFTSQSRLNPYNKLNNGIFGRINISQRILADNSGLLIEHRLAWLLAIQLSISSNIY